MKFVSLLWEIEDQSDHSICYKYILMYIDIFHSYHYTNLTFVSECVCESGRSTEAIRPEIKTNEGAL